jgi:hypothetical protein
MVLGNGGNSSSATTMPKCMIGRVNAMRFHQAVNTATTTAIVQSFQVRMYTYRTVVFLVAHMHAFDLLYQYRIVFPAITYFTVTPVIVTAG